jgi:hypothetical protein
MIKDKRIVTAIDKLVWGMRGVTDEMSPDERQVLLSVRAISGDIADRLEAPSSRASSDDDAPRQTAAKIAKFPGLLKRPQATRPG